MLLKSLPKQQMAENHKGGGGTKEPPMKAISTRGMGRGPQKKIKGSVTEQELA